jgi:outer membrane lipoprotein-sorting protein
MKISQSVGRISGAAVLGAFLALESMAADHVIRSQDALESVSPLQAAPPGLTGEEVFKHLVEHSHQRDSQLQRYSALRTYEVSNPEGKIYGQKIVEVDYDAPDRKTFVTKSEEGSWLVRRLVLDRLIASEQETASGKDHQDSSISPGNYSFELLGEQQLGPYSCYVVEATPRRTDKYLFEGRIWISKEDFGIVRIAGHPAKKLSFWIERVEFVRKYQKIHQFWLPQRDETVAKIRLKGTKLLTINHADYTINSVQATQEQSQDVTRVNAQVNRRREEFRAERLEELPFSR